MSSIQAPNVSLPHLTSGKVRDLYSLPSDPSSLLFVASDRVSAYDVVLSSGIPNKGAILTQLAAHWFSLLPSLVPGNLSLKHHFLRLGPPGDVVMPAAERKAITPRSMTVRKLRVLPIEAIVRGYLAGSAWQEYKRQGTIHGIKLPEGLKQCSSIPGGAIYSPSTKAPAGQHDENIHPSRAADILGSQARAARVEELALAVYNAAASYAQERGIIIADTKFEFGLDEETGDVVLVDEVLTPDSSRFWPVDGYEEGRDQESFDKQILRNWLKDSGLKGKEGVMIDGAVAKKTEERYREAFRMLTGRTFEGDIGL